MIRTEYQADRRLGAVQVKSGSTSLLVDLDKFLRVAHVDLDEEEGKHKGVLDLTIPEFVALKKAPYKPKGVQLNEQRIRDVKKRRDISTKP